MTSPCATRATAPVSTCNGQPTEEAASPCEFSSAYDVARHYFPDANWGTAGHPMHVETRLPIWLYLTQHDRGTRTERRTVHDVVRLTREWLARSKWKDTISFDDDSKKASHILGKLASEVRQGLFRRRIVVDERPSFGVLSNYICCFALPTPRPVVY